MCNYNFSSGEQPRLGDFLGFSQFEKKEKRKRNARLKVDSKNNTRSVTLFPNYFASYFVVIQDPCLHACRVHCFRAFETSMLIWLYTVYFSIATTAVAAVYAMQPHGTPLYFEIISSCAASLHLFCTNTRYKFHECNKRWFWDCGFV